MEENGGCFLEWLEEFVCQERGSRIVHYLLKDSEGRSVLAVVGTERSLRHMVYIVAEEFLEYSGPGCHIQAGFKWRSRREVVDWLTSMLSKQHQSDFPNDSIRSLGSNPHHFSVADKMDLRVRNLKQSYSDIMWLGASWTCGKQLKHFPAFCRNGTTIAAQSFVFVMAKGDNRYVAYLEDMYEDKKGQKKVKVRWFHHSQEVKGVVRLRNAHPKEVYITPYTQVISVECVDGPAIVLTREHFDKCIGDFPDGLLAKLHLCFRQFRSNKIKPFDLSKLKGYFDQPLISCLESDSYLNLDSRVKSFRRGDNVGKAMKRARGSGDQESSLTNMYGREGVQQKKFMRAPLPTQLFKVDGNVELLCQDSGIRGCWFRCTVSEISRKQIRLQYSDLDDQDGYGNLKEWVPAFRLAAPDKLGMRCPGRSTIRPFPPVSIAESDFEVGDPVDAWWSDGWWEGVVTAVRDAEDDNLQVYIPGEGLFLNVQKKDLRVSRDWVGGKWFDVRANREILSIISPEARQCMGSNLKRADVADEVALKSKEDGNNDKEAAAPILVSSAGHQEQLSSSDKDNIDSGNHADEKCDNINRQDMCSDGDLDGNVDNQNVDMSEDDVEREDKFGAEVKKTAALREGVSDAQDVKNAVPDEDLQLADMAM